MKKLILVVALSVAGMSAFADTTTAVSGSASIATTESSSVAGAAVVGSGNSKQGQKQGQDQGQLQGQQQAITGNSPVLTFAPVTTNVASDLKDQGATAAAINAAAAIKIAEMQNGANGSRDLSADQRAALDREAAIEIARLGQTVKNTPGIVLGQLVSSNDTCMGSVSVGGSGPGFSIGVGTTYTDDNCKLLKNSRELWNMGMKAASLALMCKNADNREALELTGFECPQTTRDKKAAVKVSEASPEVTDPIVRARLGLDSTVAAK